MMEVTQQPTVPVDVASQQEPPPQAGKQDGISADFAGAAHLANQSSANVTTEDLSACRDYMDTPPYSHYAKASAQARTDTGGSNAYPGGKFVFGEGGETVFIPSPDTGTGTPYGASGLGFARTAALRSIAPTDEGPNEYYEDGERRDLNLDIYSAGPRAYSIGGYLPMDGVGAGVGAGVGVVVGGDGVGRSGRFPPPPPWGLLSDSPQAYRIGSGGFGGKAPLEGERNNQDWMGGHFDMTGVQGYSAGAKTRRTAGAGPSGVWPDDRLWDGEFAGRGRAPQSSTGAPSRQVHAMIDVAANVPVRVQLTTPEHSEVSQGSNRQIPAGYSQRFVTGTDQGRRHLAAAPRTGAVGVAAAPQSQAAPLSDASVDEPTLQFLTEWSAVIGEGPEISNQFFMGMVDRSVTAVKERIHAALERKLIEMLGLMAEHLRMPTLEKLLKQPNDNTLDLVEKHLPDIGKVIPEKQKKELTELLESVGIKWPKLFG